MSARLPVKIRKVTRARWITADDEEHTSYGAAHDPVRNLVIHKDLEAWAQSLDGTSGVVTLSFENRAVYINNLADLVLANRVELLRILSTCVDTKEVPSK